MQISPTWLLNPNMVVGCNITLVIVLTVGVTELLLRAITLLQYFLQHTFSYFNSYFLICRRDQAERACDIVTNNRHDFCATWIEYKSISATILPKHSRVNVARTELLTLTSKGSLRRGRVHVRCTGDMTRNLSSCACLAHGAKPTWGPRLPWSPSSCGGATIRCWPGLGRGPGGGGGGWR